MLVLFSALLFLPVPASSEDEEVSERFTANVMSVGGPGRSRTTTMDITIERWSSEEERAALLEVAKQNDSRELVRAMRDLDRIGTARLRGGLSYDIRYSREFMDGETRHIVLATDRPIGAQEARANWRTMENNISIVQMELGEDGRGEGTFMVGAEVEFDEETDALQLTHFGTQPTRLTGIRTRN